MKTIQRIFKSWRLNKPENIKQSGFFLLALVLAVGCAEKAAEPERSTHPAGWIDTSSANFHGKFLAERGVPEGYQACRECHGADNSAVATGKSCFGCHAEFPHPAGWSSAGSANLHQIFIQQKGWRLDECQACHGADYRTAKAFGDTTISCFTCHTGNSGPVGCRVCHGGANSSAPPADLLGGTDTDLITVGAHTAHVDESGTYMRVACAQCHAEFAGFSDPNHIDKTTVGVAEVVFGAIATDSGRVAPIWDRTNGTCSSVYCHGAFDGGVNTAPLWTATSLPNGCASCHGFPPATHTSPGQQGACTSCHLFGQATHVNGVVDF